MDRIRHRGIIKEIQRGDNFLVVLADHTSHVVKAYLSGKMRIDKITLAMGDAVDVELSPYDLTRGRIVWRHKT